MGQSFSEKNNYATFLGIFRILSITLIVCGAILMLIFGHAVYEIITNPSESVLLNYLLAQLPQPKPEGYELKAMSEGRVLFETTVPPDLFSYGRFIFAFLIWAMVGGIVTNLISAGVHILKGLNHLYTSQIPHSKETI